MSIKPIKQKKISEEVLEQMKEHIISGEWAPGSKIPGELDLVKMFGVSRVSIRNAIHKLVGMGVLTIRQGEGTFVTEILPRDYFNSLLPVLMINGPDIMEILEFRAMIEIDSARLASQRADEEDIARMSDILERMRECQGDCRLFAIEDLNFHTALAMATHNSVVVKVNAILHDLLMNSMEKIVELTGFEGGIHYHKRILDAVTDRNEVQAVEAMKEHIEVTISKIMQKGVSQNGAAHRKSSKES